MKKLFNWIKKWFWDEQIKELPKDKPIRIKGSEVFHEYVVLNYHGQKINLHQNEIPLWNKMSRKDKRAMALKFKKQVAEGKIVFATINGKEICLKNKKYAEQANI